MDHVVDIGAVVESQGLVLLEVVKEDYDHDVYRVERDGKVLYLKAITKPELWPNLVREIAYSNLLAAFGETVVDWTVTVSRPMDTGDGWILRDAIHAPPLLQEGRLDDRGALARLARALADLDRLSPDRRSARPSYRDPDGNPLEDEVHRDQELERWLHELEEQRALDGIDVVELRAHLHGGRPDVEPGFEMWDVKLDDFLDLPDGTVGVYDLEWAHLHGRRHYDVARLYSRLAIPYGTPEAATHLLESYLSSSVLPVEAATAALEPVLTEALVAELYGATIEDHPELQERARRLLRALLDGRLHPLSAGGSER